MEDPTTGTQTHKLRDRLLLALPPILLCVVGCTQIYLARTSSLTAWRGGGFGMYSAVESPFTRFLRIFLITHEEEIPIFLGERFQQMAGEVRAAPDTGRLARLAEKLSAATWASVSLNPEVEGYLSHASSVALQEPGADIRGVIDFDDLPAAGYLYPGRLKLIRMVDEGQHLKDPSEVVEVRSIRAEVWAYTFDAVDPGLRAEKLLEVSSAAKGR